MTPADPPSGPSAGVLAFVATTADVVEIAPLARTGSGAAVELVVAGARPMEIDLELEDRGVRASRVLLTDVRPDADAPSELAVLLPRLDDLLRESGARGVVVRGGTPTALAVAQCAVWRAVPVVHLPVPGATGPAAATQAAVAGLVAWQAGDDDAVTGPADLAAEIYRSLVPPAAPRLVPLGLVARPAPRGLTA